MTLVVMMACDRDPSYVGESLRGVFAAEPSLQQVAVVVDGTDAGFMGRWAADPRVVVHLLREEPDKNEGTERRTVRTFRRCLELHKETGSLRESLVVVQDDVEFAPGWLTKTREGISACRAMVQGDRPWVLQVYTPFGLHDMPVHELDPDLYYANVGLVVPWQFVIPLLDHVGAPGVPRADDLAVADFLKVNGGAYLALNPSVVQHTGDVSAQVRRRIGGKISPCYRLSRDRSPTFGPLPERPSFRVYGVTKGHGSFRRLTDGATGAFGTLERGGELFAYDDLDGNSSDGAGHPCGILVGAIGCVGAMTSRGRHRRRFAVVAPNSEWLPRKVIEKVDAHAQLVAPSTWGAQVLARYVTGGRAVPPFHHGVDAAFRSEPSNVEQRHWRDGTFRVLHLSSTDRERKGTRQLLEAWVSLVDSGALGDTERLLLTAVVDSARGTYGNHGEHPAVNLVHRHLNLDAERMAALYRSVDVLCQPSRAEGFGLCPLEARACGTVVVATACTGHADHITAGDPGVVVVPHGPHAPIDDAPSREATAPLVYADDIAAALLDAYERFATLDVEAKNAAQEIREKWAWAAVTKRWLQKMELW